MKTKQMNKVVVIISIAILMVSMLILSACGKKEPEVVTLNKQESITLIETAAGNMLEVENIYIILGPGTYMYADTQRLYDHHLVGGAAGNSEYGQEWEVKEGDKWVAYTQIGNNTTFKREMTEVDVDYNPIEKLVNDYPIGLGGIVPALSQDEIEVMGVKIGNDKYEIDMTMDGIEVMHVVVDNGYVTELTMNGGSVIVSYNITGFVVPEPQTVA